MMTNPNIIKISSIWLLFMAISVDAQETSKRTFGGINVSTNGYGIFLQSYFSKSNSKIKNSITLHAQSIKHAQETRIKNSRYLNPNPYVLGKINAGAGLGINITSYYQIGTNQGNSPKLYIGTSLGPILGVMKPYYVVFDKLGDRNQTIIQNENIINKQDSIIGGAIWTKGLRELSFTPGVDLDINLSIQWKNYNRNHLWQNGIRINYFPNGLNILLKTENSVYFSVYTRYGLSGKY